MEKFKAKYDTRLVYAADEFYLKSGRELPDGEYYETYCQIENGVGMWTSLKEEFLYETEKEIEKQKLEKAKIALETAEIEAKATRVTADAEAYKNQKLVSAGLTPQEKAQIEKEIAIGVARELKEVKFPEYYIAGGNGGGTASLLESLLGVKLLGTGK